MGLHFIVSEYPPETGGVSDYARALAHRMASSGYHVHVWCPGEGTEEAQAGGVQVHRVAGRFQPADLLRIGKGLGDFQAPRRLLVHWVPHGYGWRSMNLPFCLWLLFRSVVRRDAVEIIVHEAFLSFRAESWRQNLAAAAHRVMMMVLLQAARRIWMSTPSWERFLRPYLLNRRIAFRWLPVPATIPVAHLPKRVLSLRQTLLQRTSPNETLWGHFGSYTADFRALLEPILSQLLERETGSLLLIGRGSDAFRARLLQWKEGWADRILATGTVPAEEISLHLSACDVLLQPYPDGVSFRRTTMTAALAHGKPVVTNDGPNTEELWRSHSGGFSLVAHPGPGCFLPVCEKLARDREGWADLENAARRFYAVHFDWPGVVQTLAAVC